jgi:thiol-disulfide isomerase/thioredoxin
LSEYRGKVVVLIFWDYHCGFCLDELPFERELYSRLAPRDVEIIGVYTDPDLPDYKQQSQRNPVPWRNLWDVPGSMRAGPLCRELGVRGVPFTVVLDRGGAVSAVNARNAQLEQAIVKVLERGK